MTRFCLFLCFWWLACVARAESVDTYLGPYAYVYVVGGTLGVGSHLTVRVNCYLTAPGYSATAHVDSSFSVQPEQYNSGSSTWWVGDIGLTAVTRPSTRYFYEPLVSSTDARYDVGSAVFSGGDVSFTEGLHPVETWSYPQRVLTITLVPRQSSAKLSVEIANSSRSVQGVQVTLGGVVVIEKKVSGSSSGAFNLDKAQYVARGIVGAVQHYVVKVWNDFSAQWELVEEGDVHFGSEISPGHFVTVDGQSVWTWDTQLATADKGWQFQFGDGSPASTPTPAPSATPRSRGPDPTPPPAAPGTPVTAPASNPHSPPSTVSVVEGGTGSMPIPYPVVVEGPVHLYNDEVTADVASGVERALGGDGMTFVGTDHPDLGAAGNSSAGEVADSAAAANAVVDSASHSLAAGAAGLGSGFVVPSIGAHVYEYAMTIPVLGSFTISWAQYAGSIELLRQLLEMFWWVFVWFEWVSILRGGFSS